MSREEEADDQIWRDAGDIYTVNTNFEERQSTATAPWRRLPLELLELILLLVNDAQDQSYTFPTLVSLVNSEWRNLALMMPRLWSHIKITDHCGVYTAQVWLERSKSAPVSIECSFTDDDHPNLSKTLDLVRGHLDHVADLDIRVDDEPSLNEVVRALNKPAPSMRAFKLYALYEDFIYDSTIQIANAAGLFGGQDTPNLQFLHMVLPRSLWPAGLTRHLTELVLSAPPNESPARLFQLVEGSPNLFRLKIDQCTWVEPMFELPPEAIISTMLEHLHFEGHCLDPQVVLLQYLDLPNLRSLHHAYLFAHDLDNMPDTVTPALSSLDKLSFSHGDGEPDLSIDESVPRYLPRILRRCDNLTQLHLDTTLPLDTLLRDMAEAGSYHLCPSLVHLRMVEFDFHVEGKILREFLEKRLEFEVPIETVSFPKSKFLRIKKRQAKKYCALVTGHVKYHGEVLPSTCLR